MLECKRKEEMLASFAASEGGGTVLPAFLSATFPAAFRPSKVLSVWKACFCPHRGCRSSERVRE